MKNMVTIRNNAAEKRVVIDIEGIIGEGESLQFEDGRGSVSTYSALKALLERMEREKPDQITVDIRSTGGSVQDALLIHDYLRSTGARITTRCFGYVASAATIIAQAGSPGGREISANALYLIHNSLCEAEGNRADIAATAQLLRQTDRRIAEIYAAAGGRGVALYSALMEENGGRGRWLSPREAVGYGLADTVCRGGPIPRGEKRLVENLGLPPLPAAGRRWASALIGRLFPPDGSGPGAGSQPTDYCGTPLAAPGSIDYDPTATAGDAASRSDGNPGIDHDTTVSAGRRTAPEDGTTTRSDGATTPPDSPPAPCRQAATDNPSHGPVNGEKVENTGTPQTGDPHASETGNSRDNRPTTVTETLSQGAARHGNVPDNGTGPDGKNPTEAAPQPPLARTRRDGKDDRSEAGPDFPPPACRQADTDNPSHGPVNGEKVEYSGTPQTGDTHETIPGRRPAGATHSHTPLPETADGQRRENCGEGEQKDDTQPLRSLRPGNGRSGDGPENVPGEPPTVATENISRPGPENFTHRRTGERAPTGNSPVSPEKAPPQAILPATFAGAGAAPQVPATGTASPWAVAPHRKPAVDPARAAAGPTLTRPREDPPPGEPVPSANRLAYLEDMRNIRTV